MAGRIGVLVFGALRSIGGAVGRYSLVDEIFCVELESPVRDINPSDEFGILAADDVEWSWSDDALLSLCDEFETKRKLELEDILKRLTSKPSGAGTRMVRPGGKSGKAGKTGCTRLVIECGTLPTVIGAEIIRFLYRPPSFASTFNSYFMWINRLVFESWLGIVVGTSIICSYRCSVFLLTPPASFFNKR